MREILIGASAGSPSALLPRGLARVSLVSPSLMQIALLVAVAAIGLTGTALALRTRPGQRRRPRLLLAACVASLVLTQVLVLAALSLKVNASLGFVQTVGDLGAVISSQDSDAEIRLAPVGGAQSQAGSGQSEEDASASDLSASDPSQPPADFTPTDNGFVKASVTGARSGVTQEVWVWTPRGYSTSDERSYPVIVFLHGQPGSSWGTANTLNAAQSMQAAIDSGALPPAIFVVPDLNADQQQKSNPDCADIVGHAQVGTWVQEDVPALVRASFPNASKDRSQWAIAGLSAGAYCAGWTAMMRSDVYGSAIMMSGYDVPVLGGMSTSAQLRRDNTLSMLIDQHRHQPLDLWVLGAEDDLDSVEVARNLRERAPSSDSVEISTPHSGGHSWTLWASRLPQALTWWGQKMGMAPSSSDSEASAQAASGASGPGDGGLSRLADTVLPVSAAWTIALAWVAALATSLLAVRRRWRRRHGRAGASRRRGARTTAALQRSATPGRLRRAVGLLGSLGARTVLVCAASVLVSISIGLLANRMGAFYFTWGDVTADMGHALGLG
ncbi:alpha/beta hydrolase [Actinomyces urogenitalis]|uniref:alpha/beta hydrolase n=1 Tax=Actinomyces urogenitalis TaxID=103621 RepID=UPI00242BDE2A|nr:alpha/beta hydrolase-fold protein [Actinomyces urogenitalis]MCI7456475.1 esterase family protein [Actinomyces urogenitalis]